MNELLYDVSLSIIIHISAAIIAVALGLIQLLGKKGTTSHRILGRVWVIAMAIICISSFGIKDLMPTGAFGGYSPIHLLSIMTLAILVLSISAAVKGNIKLHRITMISTYIGALIIAGLFTFLPGRLLYRVVVEPLLNLY